MILISKVISLVTRSAALKILSTVIFLPTFTSQAKQLMIISLILIIQHTQVVVNYYLGYLRQYQCNKTYERYKCLPAGVHQ
jgi:hypothetical protein